MISRLLPVVLATGAIVLAAQWSAESRDPVSEAQSTVGERPGPFLQDARIDEFDRHGRLRARVAARRIEQDPRRGSLSLVVVDLEYLAVPGRIWRMTARHGAASKGFGTVTLSGDVIMTGGRDRAPGTTVLRTGRLVLDTESQIARSPLPVTVTVGDNSLAALGAIANLKEETLRLESRVHGYFAP